MKRLLIVLMLVTVFAIPQTAQAHGTCSGSIPRPSRVTAGGGGPGYDITGSAAWGCTEGHADVTFHGNLQYNLRDGTGWHAVGFEFAEKYQARNIALSFREYCPVNHADWRTQAIGYAYNASGALAHSLTGADSISAILQDVTC